MLHIPVHRDDDVAIRMVESAGQRELMAVIARQKHRLHMAVFALQTVQNFAALVARTIIDKDDFPVEIKTGHGLFDGFVKMLQIVLFVINRYDDG